MTRAERALQLTAKLQMANKLKKFVTHPVLEESGCSLPTMLSEMRLEITELKRQMGGSEKREFNRLLEAWKGGS